MHLFNHVYYLNFNTLKGILWGKFESDYVPNQWQYFKNISSQLLFSSFWDVKILDHLNLFWPEVLILLLIKHTFGMIRLGANVEFRYF